MSRDETALDIFTSFSACSGVPFSIGCWKVGTFSDGVFVWAVGLFGLGLLCLLFSSLVLSSDNDWNLFLTGMEILSESGMVLVWYLCCASGEVLVD